MKIKIENLGVLRYAEMEMGKLTVLCGLNNSGKTYVTYAIYGFLHYWNKIFKIPIDSDIMNKLIDSGVCEISARKYADDFSAIIKSACDEYSNQLASVFSAQRKNFANTSFSLDVDSNEIAILAEEYSVEVKSANAKTGLKIYKKSKDDNLTITLFSENGEARTIPEYIISDTISNALKKVVFGAVFPSVFIASAERTGAAIFRKELNFARNKILETISKNDKEIDPFFLLRQGKSDYAWPVDHNVDFVRNLESISKNESELYLQHNSVLALFSSILGGDYQVTDKDELFFSPHSKSNAKLRLSMDESSSSVRSLLDIGFYLKHEAKLGDLLIIDEPELNLHPNNQRKMARLLTSLVNCGIKIFVTTHSDYILREINNLILLNGESPHLMNIVKNEGYNKIELIKADDIRIYTACRGAVHIPNNKRKSTAETLFQVSVDDEYGIHSSSFDESINEMNRIADEIMFGG